MGIRTARVAGQEEPPITEDTVMALAPRRAVAPLSVSVGDGIATIRWATDVTGERLTTNEIIPFHRKQGNMPPESTSLLQRTWYLLDDKMEIIMNRGDYDNTDWQKARYEARGIAEVLAMFMVPHFSTADEIAGEARDRYYARKNGNEEYETKGLGVRRLELAQPRKYAPSAEELRAASEAATKPRAAKKTAAAKTGNKIPDAAVATSKQALESGMFTADQLAKVYKMSAAEVKQQLGIA